ncbi:hypothetical protein [Pyxidicoccus caerfyrddinensis]|nr:hypothetical protein [Pyxidicoccus caerfyrddinensis]
MLKPCNGLLVFSNPVVPIDNNHVERRYERFLARPGGQNGGVK